MAVAGETPSGIHSLGRRYGRIPYITRGLDPALDVYFSHDVGKDERKGVRSALEKIWEMGFLGNGFSRRVVYVEETGFSVQDLVDDTEFGTHCEGSTWLQRSEVMP